MYFWNISALKKELKAGKFSDAKTIPYVYILLGLYALSAVPLGGSLNSWDYIVPALSAVITVLGTYYAFTCVNGKKSVNFFHAFFTLGWVVAIRLLVFGFLPIVMCYVVLSTVFSVPIEQTSWIDAVIVLTFSLIYYHRLGTEIKEVAHS